MRPVGAGAGIEGLVVVAYDIRSHRLRARVSEVLADYGGVRVQKSVFECELTPARLAALQLRLAQLVTSAHDSVRFYHLCEACRARVEGTPQDRRPRAAAPVIV